MNQPDTPMSASDPLIQRITDRLGVDPELRLEVARELRTHLADCEAEFRAGGAGEEEARAIAEKALGDPGELAEQLWQANRSRLRLRAVVRWAASIALLPAAIATVVFLVPVARSPRLSYEAINPVLPPHWTKGLSEEQRFILEGDPNAETPDLRAKSVADRWPENPVYYGHYVSRSLWGFLSTGEPDSNRTAELLALANRGEQVDPDNAYYNFLKAAWFIRLSSVVEDDSSRPYEAMDYQGKVSTRPADKLRIREPIMFHRGLEEFRRGLDKPVCMTRAVEMDELRASLLPPARGWSDLLAQTPVGSSTSCGYLPGLRAVGRAVSAYAIDQAARGDASATVTARSATSLADMLGAGSRTLDELLAAQSIRRTGLAAMEQVGKELKDDALATSAFHERRRDEEFIRALRSRVHPGEDRLRGAGMVRAVMTPRIPGNCVDFEPLRTTESFVLLEMSLRSLLVILTVLAALFGLGTLWGMVFRRSHGKPILLFVGWRRIGRIVLISIVLPLVLYGVYAWWQVASPNAYGLNYTLGRVLAEIATVLAAVIVLLLAMSYRAIRQRCQEIGLAVPMPVTLRRRWVMVTLGTLAALACIIYVVGWWTGPLRMAGATYTFVWSDLLIEVSAYVEDRPPVDPTGFLLGAAVLLLVGVWALNEWFAVILSKAVAFRRSFFRSAMPIFCSAVIVVGLAVGGVLSLGESLSARRVTGDAGLSFTHEVDRSDYRLLRDQFRARNKQAMENMRQGTPAPATRVSSGPDR